MRALHVWIQLRAAIWLVLELYKPSLLIRNRLGEHDQALHVGDFVFLLKTAPAVVCRKAPQMA
jgi:hypothetical protein